ncbi:MAG: hypothetical protein HXY23_02130 [Parvularculaceae bacterium]|nr:hypothetical protein [Parvularculaceae bacterium]
MNQSSADASADAAEMRQLLADLEASMDGEPRGLNFAELAQDRRLQRLAVQLWKEVQTRSAISKQKFEQLLRREDLTPADLWAPGITESLNVASTGAEIARFKAKLRFRADVLTVLLEETMADLERAESWTASDAKDDGAPRS